MKGNCGGFLNRNNMEKMNKEKQLKLVKKASAGDKDAFEELYKMHFKGILYNSYSMLNDYNEAQDAAQEVIVGMLKNLKNLKKPENFTAWMFKIVNNVCVSMVRKKMTRKESFSNEEFFESIEEDSVEHIPHKYLEDDEMKDLLIKCLDKLSDKHRRALYLYYFEDLSYKDIGDIMGLSVSVVASNIYRGKTHLKELLEKESGDTIDTESGMIIAPALAMAFDSSKEKMFPNDVITPLEDTFDRIVEKVYASGELSKSSAASFWKTIAKMFSVVIIGTSLITAGIMYLVEPPSEQKTPAVVKDNTNQVQEVQETPQTTKITPEQKIEPTPEKKKVSGRKEKKSPEKKIPSVPENIGEVFFTGGDCECNHVNPKTAKLKGISSDVSAQWHISDDLDQQVFYKGNGKTVKKELAKLYRKEKDGKYTIVFQYKSISGNKIEVVDSIRIDTSEVSHNQYS